MQDRPSLHDVVRDYVQQLFSPTDLRLAHRSMVESFRTSRPAPRGWKTRVSEIDPVAKYVSAEIGHHIEAGWDTDWAGDTAAVQWLDDFPGQQDAIPIAAARVLGAERTSVLAQQAEHAGLWWSAALRWSAAAVAAQASLVAAEVGRMAPTLLRASASALERIAMGDGSSNGVSQLNKDRLEFKVITSLMKMWDKDDMPRFKPRLDELKDSEAAREDADGLFQCILVGDHYPALLAADSSMAGHHVAVMAKVMTDAAALVDDPFERGRLLACGFTCMTCWFDMMRLDIKQSVPEWSTIYGENGSLILEGMRLYDPSKTLQHVVNVASLDMFGVGPSGVWPLLLHFGDIDAANSVADQALSNLRPMLGDWLHPSEQHLHTVCFLNQYWPLALHLLNRRDDMAKLMVETHLQPGKDDTDANWARWAEACPAYGGCKLEHTTQSAPCYHTAPLRLLRADSTLRVQ